MADDDNLHAHAALALLLVRAGGNADRHVERVAGGCWVDLRVELAGALHGLGRRDEAIRVLTERPGLAEGRISMALVDLGEEELGLARLEGAAEALDAGTHFHRALLRHRAGQPVGRAFLDAFSRGGGEIARILLGESHAMWPYALEARDAWRETPGALASLAAWWREPRVGRWLEALRSANEAEDQERCDALRRDADKLVAAVERSWERPRRRA